MLRAPGFIAAHRVREQDFTRKRCLNFDVLVMFLLQMIGGRSLQVGLDQFLGGLAGANGLLRRVTKSALSQARKKVRPSAFSELCRQWTEKWSANINEARWRGWRLVAADGVCLRLPTWRETQEQYGLGPRQDGSVVMTRLVGLFTAASRQMLHVQIGTYLDGERNLLLRALHALAPTDLLVLDRGYPAWWLFASFAQRGITYCVRMDSCGCGRSEMTALLRSELTDIIVCKRLDARAKRQLASIGETCSQDQIVQVRLIKVILPNGHFEILATSLLDQANYPASEFGQIYRNRWNIEECFKTLKHRLHIEGFTGELPQAIEQEIHAKILIANITVALCETAHDLLPEAKRKHYRVNQTIAIKHWPTLVVNWFRFDGQQLHKVLENLVELLVESVNKYRPNRKFPRNFGVRGARPPRRAYH